MPYAISYTRFSALHQAKGSSLDRQQELISRWLRDNPDYELSPLSKNDTGRSAYKGEHLKYGLGTILAAIEDNKIKNGDVLLIEALDRLGRQQPMDMLGIISKILKSGITIITLEDNVEYSEASSSKDISQLYILLGKIQQAHEYSLKLSRRIKAAYENKEKLASQGQKIKKLNPYWLNSDGTLRDKESAAVRKCIELYLKGHGTRSILLQLFDSHPDLREVHPSTLKRWFRNKALIGEWRGTFPLEPLIDKDTFYKLQQQLLRRRVEMSPEQTYDLSGLVVCRSCNSRYYFRRKAHKLETIIYGNCSTYLKRGEEFCRNKTSLPYEALLHTFHLSKFNHLWIAASKHALDKTLQDIELLELEEMEISAKLSNLVIILESNPNQPQILKRLSELEEARNSISGKILNLKSGHIKKESNHSLLDYYSELADGSELADKIHLLKNEISKDPIMQREALKLAGYRIYAEGHEIECPPNFKFEIVRRSQTHKRYILRLTITHTETNQKTISWAAVSRNYRTIEAPSETALIKLMADWQPSDEELINVDLTDSDL